MTKIKTTPAYTSIQQALLTMSSHSGHTRGFSLLEVLFALGTLGLVMALLFQGLGQIESAGDFLRKRERILAVRDAVQTALKLQTPETLQNNLLQPVPLFAVVFNDNEPELHPCKDLSLASGKDPIPDWMVYGQPFETKGMYALSVSLHPVSLRGALGESVYTFPFCL